MSIVVCPWVYLVLIYHDVRERCSNRLPSSFNKMTRVNLVPVDELANQHLFAGKLF